MQNYSDLLFGKSKSVSIQQQQFVVLAKQVDSKLLSNNFEMLYFAITVESV